MANEEVTKNYLKAITETGDEAGDAKKQKHRSPAYTSIGLKEAVEKARVIWEHEKRNEVAVDVAAGHWKVAAKSSTTLMAVSALKKFGLITDRGSGDQRYLKLTDLAYNILRAEPNTPAWISFVQKAALLPTIIAELWESDKENPKSTPSLKKYLEFEKHFNPAVIDEFIQSYRDTISFAKLGIGDKVLTDGVIDNDQQSHNDSNGEMQEVRSKANPADNSKKSDMDATMNLGEIAIPVAGKFARIPFPMSEEDFDLFEGTIKLWKKKLVQKPLAQSVQMTLPEPPFVVKIHNGDFEMMVKIVSAKMVNGEKIYQDENGNNHPASKVFPNLPSGQP